jgi:hypothetical protein
LASLFFALDALLNSQAHGIVIEKDHNLPIRIAKIALAAVFGRVIPPEGAGSCLFPAAEW